MKKLKFLSFAALLFSTAMLVNGMRFQYSLEDAFWRTLMTPFEGTVWAPGFKESTFSKIRTGMLAEEVFGMLGEPIRRNCYEGGCSWIYSWQDTPTADFDQRWVFFDGKKQVSEVRKSFFID